MNKYSTDTTFIGWCCRMKPLCRSLACYFVCYYPCEMLPCWLPGAAMRIAIVRVTDTQDYRVELALARFRHGIAIRKGGQVVALVVRSRLYDISLATLARVAKRGNLDLFRESRLSSTAELHLYCLADLTCYFTLHCTVLL